jgi:hypothetical protein
MCVEVTIKYFLYFKSVTVLSWAYCSDCDMENF